MNKALRPRVVKPETVYGQLYVIDSYGDVHSVAYPQYFIHDAEAALPEHETIYKYLLGHAVWGRKTSNELAYWEILEVGVPKEILMYRMLVGD